MGMPVKLSDDLVEVARSEAKVADRSITSQIEHWAKLGQVVEAVLSHSDSMALKESEGNLDKAFAEYSKRQRVHAILKQLANSTQRSSFIERLARRAGAAYEVDPKNPETLIRVDPDGTRTLGRLVDRRFVPSQQKHARK